MKFSRLIEHKKGYRELTINDFEDFIDVLRPETKKYMYLLSDNYENDHYQQCIFRGQGNSEWDLKPTIFRDSEHISQINLHEDQIIKSFWHACDRASVRLPDDTYHKRKLRRDKLPSLLFNGGSFDLDDIESLGFAQHYGVPTRLLDWSYNFLVSLYFAALSCIDEYLEDSEKSDNFMFSIWILNMELLDFYDSHGIKFLHLPTSNDHIAKQRGCFTVLVDDSKFSVGTLLNEALHKKLSNNLILKINTSWKNALKVLDYCEDYGMDAVSIYGGPHGASQKVLTDLKLRNFKKKLGWQIE